MTTAILAAGLALALSLLLTPVARRVAIALGMTDTPGGRRIHLTPIPRCEGIAVAVAVAIACGVSVGMPMGLGLPVVFGSLLAYTSFIYALRLLPATIAMTYTYVNPVIAVILGWAILFEPITNYTVLGTALILVGVYGVFRGKGRRVAQE